jgi:hypothetical protein
MADPTQDTKDPVTFIRWITGFVKAANWVKTFLFLIIAAVIIGVPAGIFFWGKHVGYIQGHLVGYEAGLDWADKHPKNTVSGNGTTINNNVCPKINKFGLQVRGCTMGMVCSQ